MFQVRAQRAALAVLIMLGLVGCAATDEVGAPASNELQFGPASPNGLVIVGLRSVDDVTSGGLIPTPQRWAVVWSRIDPATLLFARPRQDFTATRHNCIFETRHPFGCSSDHRDLQYSAHVVKPGLYALREAIYGISNRTVYASNGGSLIADTTLRDLIANKKIPWFQVKAGEIAYIGDYLFDAEEPPIKLKNIGRSDQQLEALRDRLPGMTGEITWRGATISRRGDAQESKTQLNDEDN